MVVTDIISKEECFQLEKELFDRFFINCTVYDASGVGVTGKPNWCNELCPIIKKNTDSLAAICAPGNQNFMAQAKQTKKPVIAECDAGLVKIAVPIFFEQEFLGTAGGCGRLPKGGEVETFLIEKTTGMTEEEILTLSQKIKPMSLDRAEEMALFIQKRIEESVDRYAGQKQ